MTLLTGCDLVFPLDIPAAPSDAELDDAVVADTAVDGPDLSSCPANYDVVEAFGHVGRYRVEPTLRVWQTAENQCQRDSLLAKLPATITHLAVPSSEPELLLLYQLSMTGWLGVARDADSNVTEFRTVTGDPFPAPSELWATNQPDNANTFEFAVEVVATAVVNDRSPGVTLPSICECDGRIPTATFDFVPP
jgi:hypothetical protein